MKIKYRLATVKDSDSVRKFLRQHFYPDEPMIIALQIDLDQDFHDEEYNISNIAHGACVVAVSGKQIVGACLAGPKYPDTEKKILEVASQIPNTKWQNVLLFCAALERDSNVYHKYDGVEKVIHCHILAVDKKFRGNGIGLKLFERSMERGRKLGFPLYTCDCSSIYSANICERLEMDCVHVCACADYRAPNSDAQVFFPPGEHKLVKSYAKRLM